MCLHLLRLDAELAARLSESESLESKDAAMAQRLQEETDLEDEFERSTNAVAIQEVCMLLCILWLRRQEDAIGKWNLHAQICCRNL